MAVDRRWRVGLAMITAVAGTTLLSGQEPPSGPMGEWRAFGNDGANTKYSPLAQITLGERISTIWRLRGSGQGLDLDRGGRGTT